MGRDVVRDFQARALRCGLYVYGAVTRAGHDVATVRGEADRPYGVGMSGQRLPDHLACRRIPDADPTIGRSRDNPPAIGGERET